MYAGYDEKCLVRASRTRHQYRCCTVSLQQLHSGGFGGNLVERGGMQTTIRMPQTLDQAIGEVRFTGKEQAQCAPRRFGVLYLELFDAQQPFEDGGDIRAGR